MKRFFPLLLILAALVAALAFAACEDDKDSGGVTPAGGETPTGGETPDGGGPTTVDITLQEWAVVPAADTAAAGDVTFNITNEGPDHPHEFVVVRTDLAADALPTDADGAVDEAGEGVEVVDEVEEIEVDASEELSVNLAAGSYVLLCNIVEQPGEEHGGEVAEEMQVHYQLGMRAGFSVE